MDKLIIFDMDGLIVDSEPLHCRAYQQVFKKHGIEMTEEGYYLELSTKGTPMAEICERFGTAGVEADPGRIVTEKIDIYLKLVDEELAMMPGAAEIIDILGGRYDTALASASRRPFVERILAKFALKDKFKLVVTGSDVSNRKPHPEIFVYTAKKMGYRPADCVVLEDAEKGVKAAQRAGMKCIAVPTQYNRGGDYSGASLTVGSISEVTPELIESLFE